MKSYIENETLVVRLSVAEHMEFARSGQPIGDRINPLQAEAKIDIFPYSEIDPNFGGVEHMHMLHPDWEKRAMQTPDVRLFGNYDLCIYLTQEQAGIGSMLGSVTLAKANVTIAVPEPLTADFRELIPENGVQLQFANSENPN